MNQFFSVFQSRQDELLISIWEHLNLSIISILIAILIAVPIGLILPHFKKIAETVISATAVLQTIPSLALLAFLIPFVGIGAKPAIIALTAYALLPILRNTYTGIREVDPALKEAAISMGMNAYQRLIKVELPLAMPVIMAGIRTSMVLVVGTTTIAALIGAGGLGELILLGIDQGGDINLILLGAIPAALLAIVLDFIIRAVEQTSAQNGYRSFIAVVIVSVLIVVTPLFFNKEENVDLVIGGKIGAEPAILMNMYKLLIEDKTDLNVETLPNLGKTDFVFEALKIGDIDIYPEFTGTAVVTFLKEEAVSNDAREVYEQARYGLSEQYNMALLEPMTYNNTYAVATTQELAKQYNLKTIGDLKKVQNKLTAGFTLEFNNRQDGYQGMKELYDLNLNVKTMEPGVRQQAIQSGDINIIDAYSTDGYMVEYDLKVLEDSKNLFPPYQGAPLLLQETLNQYPQLEDILNQLSGKITNEEMQQMNYQVDFEKKDPIQVARKYLENEGLLD